MFFCREKIKEGFSYLGVVSLFWVFIQMPEVKLLSIKLIEIIGAFFFVYYFLKISRIEILLWAFFTFFLLIALFSNHFIIFPNIAYDSIIKQRYLISIARYFEFISCIGAVLLIKEQLIKNGEAFVVKSFLVSSFFLNSIILLLYLIQVIAKVTIYAVGYESIGYSLRLRGFFFEGGPYGLFLAFLIILSLLYIKSNNKYVIVLLFLILLILSRSKAALVLLLASFLLFLVVRLYGLIKSKIVRLSFTFFLVLVFMIGFYFISYIYINSLLQPQKLQIIISNDPNHYWINGGRIPGFFIAKEMIMKHPILGIGMGNYQLLRNSPEYLMFFPTTELWDYHGYGGVFDLLIEFGFLGLLLFCFYLIYLYFCTHSIMVVLFMLPFCLGLPLYFHYPYIILALLSNKPNFICYLSRRRRNLNISSVRTNI